MNRRQKLVQQQFLNNEEAVIKRLKQVYNQALKDIEKKAQALQDEINRLDAMARLAVDADEKAKLLSMKRSKIYQKQYQDAMKKQIGSILDNLQVEGFKTVSDYLQRCYEDGFIGTMFDLQGQGIPLCFPMDQEAIVRAVQLDSKISQGLYSRLGEDVALLKKKITAQVSRGIATGMSWQQVAQQLAAATNIGYNNAVRIARTEGHRIQVQGAMDACYKAKEMGADVVKQWDSTLDDSTRESHVAVDGEIRELDKPFSNGLMFPGDPSGGAAEVVNCRCALLQRARWALDEDELETLKERAEYFGLDKAKTFEEFKKKYLDANGQTEDFAKEIFAKTSKKGIANTGEVLYNSSPARRAYDRAIQTGELTPLASFELYQSISDEIDNVLVGVTTSNGIKVTGKSDHFIARVIGSIAQKRSGVTIDSILQALTSPDRIDPPKARDGGGASQRFIKNGRCSVTINPDTGNLIQVNPLR